MKTSELKEKLSELIQRFLLKQGHIQAILLLYLQILQKKLKKNGCINIATDWDDYAEQIIDVFNESKLFKKANDLTLNLETKFERRGLKLGHKIQKFTFQLH